MKKALTTLIIIFGVHCMSKADATYLHLNNGEIIECEIIDSNERTITIRTKDGRTNTVERLKIKDLTNKKPLLSRENDEVNTKTLSSRNDNKNHFWWGADLYGFYSCYSSSNNKPMTELSVTLGYRLNEYVKVGVGVGARYYFDADKNDIINRQRKEDLINLSIPIYVNLRGHLSSSRERSVIPYYSLSFGASINEGVMVRPTIGLRIGDYDRSAFLIGINYMGQTLKLPSNHINKKKSFTTFIGLNIGYEF